MESCPGNVKAVSSMLSSLSRYCLSGTERMALYNSNVTSPSFSTNTRYRTRCLFEGCLGALTLGSPCMSLQPRAVISSRYAGRTRIVLQKLNWFARPSGPTLGNEVQKHLPCIIYSNYDTEFLLSLSASSLTRPWKCPISSAGNPVVEDRDAWVLRMIVPLILACISELKCKEFMQVFFECQFGRLSAPQLYDPC